MSIALFHLARPRGTVFPQIFKVDGATHLSTKILYFFILWLFIPSMSRWFEFMCQSLQMLGDWSSDTARLIQKDQPSIQVSRSSFRFISPFA